MTNRLLLYCSRRLDSHFGVGGVKGTFLKQRHPYNRKTKRDTLIAPKRVCVIFASVASA